MDAVATFASWGPVVCPTVVAACLFATLVCALSWGPRLCEMPPRRLRHVADTSPRCRRDAAEMPPRCRRHLPPPPRRPPLPPRRCVFLSGTARARARSSGSSSGPPTSCCPARRTSAAALPGSSGRCRRALPRLAEAGRGWPRLAEIGRGWPRLAEIGRDWPGGGEGTREAGCRRGARVPESAHGPSRFSGDVSRTRSSSRCLLIRTLTSSQP